MDINQKKWANEILQNLEGNGFEIEPFGEDLEFIATRGESLCVLITFAVTGLVFSIAAHLSEKGDIFESVNRINRRKGLLKAVRGFGDDGDGDILLTFCYPMYADSGDIFEMTFVNFIEECDVVIS